MATIKKSGLEASDFAKRFKDFRTTIIDKVQMRAAEKMNITRGFLSSLESGSKRPGLDLVELLIEKYNLNTEWLATGLGDKQTTGPAKPTVRGSLSQAHADLSTMRQSMKILHSNLNQLYDIIEKQQKQIDTLTQKIEGK
ncbi:helix-turn-helix transcriptional regulator [Pedobacter sp. ASV1-7]|uniref:helix-turn-helix domain-containing protein n=1 Tax=Pedobacter sp. ASV1-7 TaxID=3145237 RepID=UPI0032E89FDF